MYGERPSWIVQALTVAALASVLVCLQATPARGAVSVPSGASVSGTGASPSRWAWPFAGEAAVLLGFGASYSDGSQARTHSGCDLAGEAGQAVRSPMDATATFVGEVPSSSGRRILTVTLEAPDGARLTLMPLEGACVAAGDRVAAGQRLASLAEDGDASSGSTHLHVGLRHGTLYVDPLSALTPPAAVAEEPPIPADHPAVEPATRVQPAVAPPARISAGEVPAPRAAPRPSSAPAARPAVVQAPSSSGVSLSEGSRVVRGGSLHSPAGGAANQGAVQRAGTRPIVTGAASPSAATPALITSLPSVIRALRTRDRLLATAVSYLLATIAAAGCLGAALKSVGRPVHEANLALSTPIETD
jgi:murein DD-endopeptidase MepM/ murein hydrolase activator NlpD